MIKNYVIIFLLTAFLGLNAHSANNDFEIVAIVGDDAISMLDVEKRIDLAIASSGLKPTKDIKQKLFPQIVRVLIDEKLYQQEAEKLNVSVSELDLKTAMFELEKRNKIKQGTFVQFLESQNIPADAAIDQLRSQLLWNKIVARKVRPKIIITDFELQEKLEHISNSSGTSELNISEIVLPIDENKDEKQVRSAANKLVDEIRDGAEFAAVAKEFSRAANSDSGGELGWSEEDSLPQEMLLKVRHLTVGEVSDPFKVEDSYKIIKLNDRRALVAQGSVNDVVSIKQAFVGINDMSDQSAIQEISTKFRKYSAKVESCGDFSDFAKKIGSETNSQTIRTKLKDLTTEVRDAVNKTKVSSMTDVLKGPTGLYIFMVCDRPDAKKSVVLKNRVREMLLRRKLDLQAQHYLRQMRQNVFIEIRT